MILSTESSREPRATAFKRKGLREGLREGRKETKKDMR